MSDRVKLDALRREFYDVKTTEKRLVEIVGTVQELASGSNYGLRCCYCDEFVVYLPHDKALKKGHIYSDPGKAEYGITRMCEYCFDKVTAEPEDEDFE